jgi:hypothetical protein
MNAVQTLSCFLTKSAPVIIYSAMFFGLIYFVVTIVKIIRNPAPVRFGMYYIGDGMDGSGDSGFCDLGGFDCGGFDGGGCDGGDG